MSALGPGGGAADEDALGRRLGGAVLAVEDLDEAVLVEFHAEGLRHRARLVRRDESRREHDEVGAQHGLARRGDVLDLDHRPAIGVELDLRRRAAEELDAGAPRGQEPVLVADAGRPQLEVADRHPHAREELLEAYRVLEGDHAAEARAVREVAPVARAGALDHDDLVGRLVAEDGLLLPGREHLRELDLGDDAVMTVAEVLDVLVGRRHAAGRGEDRAGAHRGAFRRLREVDRPNGTGLGAGPAEAAGVEIDGAHDAAVVVLVEDRPLARLRGGFGTDSLAGAAVHAGPGDDVGQAAEGDLEGAGASRDRLDRGASPDVQVGMVDRVVAVEALAHAGLVVGRRQALAAVVGREDRADAGGAAAEEGPPLDELDPMTHLGEFGGGLRAGDAAADDQHGVLAGGVRERVRRRRRVLHGGGDDARRLARDRVDVVAVDPGAALADVGDLHAQAARDELLKAARGEIGRAAGEDDLTSIAGLAPGSRVHELEQLGLALTAAPMRAADHVGRLSGGVREALEVDRGHRAGAFAEEDQRALGVHVAASTRGARASIASAGQPRAQVPQPRHSSAS